MSAYTVAEPFLQQTDEFTVVHHSEIGAVVEIEDEVAAPFVAEGALVPVGAEVVEETPVPDNPPLPPPDPRAPNTPEPEKAADKHGRGRGEGETQD